MAICGHFLRGRRVSVKCSTYQIVGGIVSSEYGIVLKISLRDALRFHESLWVLMDFKVHKFHVKQRRCRAEDKCRLHPTMISYKRSKHRHSPI